MANLKRKDEKVKANESFAAKASLEVFQEADSFVSKEAFKKALVKAFMKAREMSLESAERLANQVEIGLAYGAGSDPLKADNHGRIIELSSLRHRLTEAAIDSFVPIFGPEKGKRKGEEFVAALIGTHEDEKNYGKQTSKALLFQMADQIQALMKLKKTDSVPELDGLLKETLIQSLAAQAKPDMDAFILNEALLANGNKLLSTVHEALISNIGGSEHGLSLPLQI